MAFKPIEILINAKDNASSVFSSLQGKVAAVGAAIATYFGINAFVGVVQGAADLEQAMSRVQAATGASGDEMAALRKAAEDAGASTKYTSTEAAGALENLAKAGLNATDAIATLPAVLNLAQAGDIGLAESAELVTKAVMGMGLAFTDAGRVADVLALGASATNTSVLGLAQALSYAAPAANSLGLSLESTVAIIGKFADAGIDASRAGTALNSILSQFDDPASKFRTELAAAGITTTNFEDALHQLAAAGPAGSKAINAVGQEAGPALRALLNQGMGALDELTGKLKNAEGSAAATAAVMQNNLNGAINGLASAWDTVKNALGTPVLPVLKEGVDQLAAAFRNAVADGAVTKFGESIATAFKTGIQFVRDFIGTVDFGAVLTRLQDFANSANDAFTRVGEYATNAGNTIKLAYGVMTAGVNAVLVGIYGIGTAFTETAAFIVRAGISINEQLQKIAIGDAKDRIVRETEQMRLVLEGLGEASQGFSKRMSGALDSTAQSAQTARNGFQGLTGSIDGAGAAANTWQQTVAAAVKQQEIANDAFRKSEQAFRRQEEAAIASSKATAQQAEKVRLLQEAYDGFMRAGNLNEAIITMDELVKTQRAVVSSSGDVAKKQKEMADAIAAAYKGLGVVTDAELSEVASKAKENFDILTASGQASARELALAFADAAQKAIAANDGIAPSWVTAQAAARGYRVVVDEAGKSHLELADNASKGFDRINRGWRESREAVQAQEEAMDKLLMKYKLSADYTERQIALLEREAAAAEKAAEANRKRLNVDKEGYSLNTDGQRVLAGETQDQVDKDIAALYGAENIGNPDAQSARQLRTLAKLRSKGNGLVTQPGLSADERRQLQELEARLLNGIGGDAPAAATPAKPASAPTSSTGTPTVVNINFEGVRRSIETNAQGARDLQDLIRQLQDDKGRS